MNNDYYHNYFRTLPPENKTPSELDGFVSQKKVVAPDNYIDDSLFLNLGKSGEFHMSFPDSLNERDMVFHGSIYEGAQDHIIVYNSHANEWYMLPLLYLNYAVFKDKPNVP